MRTKKYFLLTARNFIIIVVAWILSVFFHNLFSGILRFEEPCFFIISAIIIPVYFLVSLVYSICYLLFYLNSGKGAKKKKR